VVTCLDQLAPVTAIWHSSHNFITLGIDNVCLRIDYNCSIKKTLEMKAIVVLIIGFFTGMLLIGPSGLLILAEGLTLITLHLSRSSFKILDVAVWIMMLYLT
jgi:hypothetical protein